MDENTLKDLRDRRKASLDAADAIVGTAETEKRGVTTDEATQIRAHLDEAERCKGELEAADRARLSRAAVDAARREIIQVVPDVARPAADPPPSQEERQQHQVSFRENPATAYQKGDALAAIVGARVRFGGWGQHQAVKWANTTFGENSPQSRALQQSVFTAGGALIPDNFVGSEFIELLRATARVRSAGARVVKLENGSWTTPKVTGGGTGYWVGQEGDFVAPSQQSFGQIKLVEKKYMSIVPISNDLRRNASLDTIRIVRDDLVRVAANDEDIAFLKGTGLSGQPKGAYNWIPAAGKANSQGTTLANIRTDIRTAKTRLSTANAPNVKRAWFMNARPAEYMGWELVDGNGNLAFPQMQQDNGATLGGATVYRDNNISLLLGSGAQTEIYYLEMSECFIGDSMDLEIEIIENMVYETSAGTLRSGVTRDESGIRLIRKTDFGMRHTESGFVLEAVSY
jgi:HK97 family phage major capsid protein